MDNWISVEDRLPEHGVMVITYPYSMVTIRHTKEEDGNTKWFFDAIEVTHWMPLPEPPPPKEEKTDEAIANLITSDHFLHLDNKLS